MPDQENTWIPKLKQQLADKLIDRREFVRYSTLLGMSAGAAYMWAGKITGQPFAAPARAADMPMRRHFENRHACAEDQFPAHVLMDL